ncbi:AUXILIN-LIKE7 [Hibiscus trionum]|nr:AUXILIN-LIKE7 [Hibiscus trionum]
MENAGFSMSNAAMFAANHHGLDADDFSDVFGGPPRTVLYRKFSGNFTPSASFYDEAFQTLDFSPSYSTKVGRSLPVFRIPARGEGFYNDIFWLDNDLQRSNWEEPSPLRPPTDNYIGLSSFAPKFRLNSTTVAADQEQTKHQMPPFPSTVSFDTENENHIGNSMKISSYYGLCKHASSPETISLESGSFRSIKISEFNSPSFPASSCFRREPETETRVQSNPMPEYGEDDDEDEDDIMSSYVIEINSDFRQSSSEEAVSIDEAIAWAKQGYNTKKSDLREHEKDQTNAYESIPQPMDGPGPMLSPPEEKQKKSKTEGKERSEDEEVKHWSSGNENNIRMLLSTLHNILWPNSGWRMIDLASLTESSLVKKAYQKARLCLHPDKLQQRGATLSQKYVAEKAFSILQDAWDAFVSRDVFYNQSTMQGVLESFWEAWNKQGVHGFEGLRTVLKA